MALYKITSAVIKLFHLHVLAHAHNSFYMVSHGLHTCQTIMWGWFKHFIQKKRIGRGIPRDSTLSKQCGVQGRQMIASGSSEIPVYYIDKVITIANTFTHHQYRDIPRIL